jgi:hypothetical protein
MAYCGQLSQMTHRMSTTRDKIAAANCRAMLAQLTLNGKVDHAAFLNEMDARAAASGVHLTAKQYSTLGKIVAAYEARRSR